jgi:hypothetical protein
VGTLGNGRFLKTIKGMIDEGPIVIKVYIVHVPQELDTINREIEKLEGIVRFFHFPSFFPLLVIFNF